MFEVGKKYINQYGKIFECLAIYDDKGWLKENARNCVDTYQWSTCIWEDYKEPRTLTKWMNVYEQIKGPNSKTLSFGGGIYDTKEKAESQAEFWTGESLAYKDSIEITYTEKV